MAKKYNYQPRTRVPTNRVGIMNVRTEERIIKKVQQTVKNGIQKLEIITPNGTRCIISQKDERYKYCSGSGEWKVLWECLAAGDKVEIEIRAGKIIDCTVDLSKNCYKIINSQKSKDDLILTLEDKEKEIEVKVTKSDIEEKRILCKDMDDTLEWDEICYAATFMDDVKIYTISERIAFLQFY